MKTKSLYVYRNIEKSFSNRNILIDIDMTLYESTCVLLAGKNGAGKSTLLKILAGLEKPNKAEIEYLGKQYKWEKFIHKIRKNIIYLHQQPFLFSGSVKSNIAYGLRFSSLSHTERKKALSEALEWSELTDLANSDAKTLSGGVQQRVVFTRAWILKPKILLLDEPMSSMDDESREKVCLLLGKMKSEGLSIVITSHISQYVDNVVNSYFHLTDGRLKEGKIPKVI